MDEGIKVKQPPSPHTFPQDIINYAPPPSVIFKEFPNPETCSQKKTISIRQIHLNVKLTEGEKKLANRFIKYCKDNGFKLTQVTEAITLRVLNSTQQKYGTEGLMEKALALLKTIVSARKALGVLSDEDTNLRNDLDVGRVYWSGRDEELRPCIVFDLKKLADTGNVDRSTRVCTFALEYGLRYLMCPGRVETAVVIVDASEVSVFGFPINMLKDLVQLLIRQFCGRLHTLWIAMESSLIYASWQVVKVFLTEVQKSKCSLVSKAELSSAMAKTFAPHQIPKKFGGTNQVEKFYPFPLNPGPFAASSTTNPSGVAKLHEAMSFEESVGRLQLSGEDSTAIRWRQKEFFENQGIKFV